MGLRTSLLCVSAIMCSFFLRWAASVGGGQLLDQLRLSWITHTQRPSPYAAYQYQKTADRSLPPDVTSSS